MGRRKSLREKQNVCLKVDKDLYLEAQLYIDNFSAFFNKCLENQIKSEIKKLKKREEERGLRIIEIRDCNKKRRYNDDDFKRYKESLESKDDYVEISDDELNEMLANL